jgi:hypothetical protein
MTEFFSAEPCIEMVRALEDIVGYLNTLKPVVLKLEPR